MFHPNIESDNTEFYSYSSAGPVRSIGMYAQDGAGTSLGLAYQLMFNRFNRYSSYYNPYSTYTLGGYTMNIPTYVPYISIDINKTPRLFSTDRNSNTSHTTNLNVTRTSSSSTSSNTSSKTKSARSARVTRRN
jgi:hypothetical protein